MENNENNEFSKEPTNFGLPEGYFQKSTSSIFNKIEWQEEHKDFPTLVRLKMERGFSVPENYFLNNESRLELIGYEKLKTIRKNPGFTLPANYFEETESRLVSEISHETESFLEKLSSIQKQNNFKTTDDYFANNELKLKATLEGEKPARIINLFSKRIGYAVAAMFLITIGFWTYNYYFVPIALEDCGTIACVDKMDLVKTKNLENLDNDELYELVNPSELEKKLDKNENNKSGRNETDSSLKDVSADDLLDEI